MKKFIGALLTGIVAIVPLQAQKTKSLLWKVEGNNIETSYVFGTFHLIPQEDFILKDKAKYMTKIDLCLYHFGSEGLAV